MRIWNYKGALLLVLVIVSIMALAISLSSSPAHASLISHTPIYINGNSGFTKPDPVNGGGTGTENDPYIIENWVINGAENHGIWINNTAAFFIIRNCLVENGMGSYYGIDLYNVTNGKVENCTFDNNRYGAYIYYLSNSTLTNNLFSNNSRYGMGLYLSGINTFRNNTFLNNAYNLDIGGSSLSEYSQDIDISNTINGKPIYYEIGESNLTFDGNTTDVGFLGLISCENILVKNLDINNNGQGILFYNTSRSSVVDSNFDNNNNGIELRTSDNNLIENSEFNNTRDGVYLWYSDFNTLRGNTLNNDDYAGFSLSYSNNNNFENNTCNNNKFYGIYLAISNNNTLDNNTCENNNFAGFYLTTSSNTVVKNNTLVNNKSYGIDLYSYDNNSVITGNICDNNNHNIYLRLSYNNIIYHNNFVNGTHQATDLSTNRWDNGYPSGGNYWSNYTGVDENHGENQDIQGSDGIGDDPYYIPGGSNVDRYPFMRPLHAPIYINGNDNFTPANGVTSGSGTENDPYIIENWDISAENSNGIYVENTTAYFAVRNCYIYGVGENSWDNYVEFTLGIYLDNVVNGKIDNCTIDNNVILLHSTLNDTLTNNSVIGSIDLYDSSQNIITNNTVSGTGPMGSGILLDHHGGNNIVDNNICENGISGIVLGGSYNILTNNTCNNNYLMGINIGDYNTIDNNTSNNNQYGILLGGSYNILTNNTCNNNHYGIEFDYADNNVLINNTWESNWQSISLWESNNNLIYHNNFINDSTQAYDENSNYWDNGYPSGGNYWSEYIGPDNYHGVNQNIAGGEGIGDTPYSISGGINQDRYPLMNPWPATIENYFDIHLLAGWNLVGFVTENIPNKIFAGLTYTTDYIIYRWSAPGGPYLLQGENQPLNDNSGYWVSINQDKWVGTSGASPTSENMHLKMGWNLVSFPITNETTTEVKIFYNNIPPPMGDYYPIYYWNAPGGPYGLQNPYTALKDNLGYWVSIDKDLVVTVP